MNEVKASQGAGTAPERRASSAGGDSPLAKAAEAGKNLPVEQSAAKERSKEVPSADVEQVVAQMNEFIQKEQRDLRFSVDEATGSTVVKVTDRTSGELIRQIPNQVFLDLAADAISNDEFSLINVYS